MISWRATHTQKLIFFSKFCWWVFAGERQGNALCGVKAVRMMDPHLLVLVELATTGGMSYVKVLLVI